MSDSLNLFAKAMLRVDGGGALNARYTEIVNRKVEQPIEQDADEIKQRILSKLQG